MSVDRYVVVEVCCDKCGELVRDDYWYGSHASMTNIKKDRRKEGWTFGKQVLCPKCAKKGGRP